MVPVLAMSIAPEPVVEASMPVESTPVTSMVVAPRCTVDVPVASAWTPTLSPPSFRTPSLAMVIVLLVPLTAEKPVMLALVFVPAPMARMPCTPVPMEPSSVTEMTPLVEPTMEAVLPVPLDSTMIPVTDGAPPLTTVRLSLSFKVAVASFVPLWTLMAAIAGSMATPAAITALAVPSFASTWTP